MASLFAELVVFQCVWLHIALIALLSTERVNIFYYVVFHNYMHWGLAIPFPGFNYHIFPGFYFDVGLQWDRIAVYQNAINFKFD